MSTGPPDERRPPEPTFADVMNGFSFDSGRSSKPRRWGRRRRDQDQEPAAGFDADPPTDPRWTEEADQDDQDQDYDDEVDGSGSTSVRPYAWTRGRTRSGYALEIETLVSTSSRGREQLGVLQYEHRSVAELCDHARSVAEVAALLSVPLGVAKVLVGDMAGLGLVVVHQTVSGNGDVPDLALMERVLSGLRRL
jgi:hypothetical protein